MKQYIAIAAAMLMMAIPASAYDQTYVFTETDFSLIEGDPIFVFFTLTITPSDTDYTYTITSTDDNNVEYSSFIIFLSDKPEHVYNFPGISTPAAPNGTITIPISEIKNRLPDLSTTLYTTFNLVVSSNNSTCTYALKLQTPLSEDAHFPITGKINPSAPVVESIAPEQFTNMEWYTERHVVHYIYSDRNGWDDIAHISYNVSIINGTRLHDTEMYNHSYPMTPNDGTYPKPINTTHTSSSFGIVEMFPENTYAITVNITDSSGLSGSKTIHYNPHPLTPVNPEPEPLFSVDPIYFCDTQAGFNAVGNLTIHNHNAPTVKISSTFFEDFHIFNGGNLVGQIAAINLRYSIPATTLSANESVTFPLKLYIPLGTKAGTIHSAGRIELTTV